MARGAKTAIRLRPGTNSLKTSKTLPEVSADIVVNPVTFPPDQTADVRISARRHNDWNGGRHGPRSRVRS